MVLSKPGDLGALRLTASDDALGPELTLLGLGVAVRIFAGTFDVGWVAVLAWLLVRLPAIWLPICSTRVNAAIDLASSSSFEVGDSVSGIAMDTVSIDCCGSRVIFDSD